jgi:NAD(P)-dependent dehydrogenase (short-subunit alcohol dehydrogenase family)
MAQRGAVFVGGGSGGIGRAICREFAARGYAVSFTYHRNKQAADVLSVELGARCRAIQLDLTDADATKAALETTASGGQILESVVYAAGPAFEMNFVSAISPADWARVMAIDVNGCFNLFHAALPHFKRQKRGNLLALTTCALKQPPKADVLSAAPKAAIDMLVKVIAKEEGRYGIRANTVELGFIEAGLAAHHIEHTWSPELIERIKANTPLRRFGQAEEVAKAVAFLCSDDASFITGQSLATDGGAQL